MEAHKLRSLTHQVAAAYQETFGTTRGACAEAAALLAALIEGEVVAGAYTQGEISTNHCWVEKGPYILDPTRSQFDDRPLISLRGSNQNYSEAQWGNRPTPPKRPDRYLAREWLKWVIEGYQEAWDHREPYCRFLQSFGINLQVEDLEDLNQEVCK